MGLTDLQTYFVLIEYTFARMELNTVSPAAIEAIFEFLRTKGEAGVKTFSAALKLSLRRFEVVLIPIHCPQTAEHPSGHWRLLAIGGRGEDEVKPSTVRPSRNRIRSVATESNI